MTLRPTPMTTQGVSGGENPSRKSAASFCSLDQIMSERVGKTYRVDLSFIQRVGKVMYMFSFIELDEEPPGSGRRRGCNFVGHPGVFGVSAPNCADQ